VIANKPFLSIVIPAYNEESRLRKTLPEFLTFSADLKRPIELVFVDDGSLDSTFEVIQKAIKGLKNARLIKFPVNRGKGAAIREGMLSARGNFVIFADADNSTPIWQAEKLLEAADERTVVIGSRYVSGSQIKIKQPFYRVVGSRFLNLIIRIILLPDIKDTQCGFKLFPQRAVAEIFPKLRLTRFSFDLEVLALTKAFGYRIKEIPIEWEDSPHSTVDPVKDGLKILRDAIRVKIHLMRGDYK
jgi:dolichyl-phosphate beta-glucosyltransferase